MSKVRTKIAVSLGDPNGIGPEIILKIFNSSKLKYNLTVIGPKKVFKFYSELLGFDSIPDENIIDLPAYKAFKPKPGTIDGVAGRLSGDAVITGIELCMTGYFDALVTLPISKKSFNLGGYKFPGHTEMIKDYTNSLYSIMIMHSGKLNFLPMTTHIPIKNVSISITKKLLRNTIILSNNILVRDFKIIKPSIAVLGLNPHSGDKGIIGKEELRTIIPVIQELKNEGLNISGAYPADGFFAFELYKQFDLIIGMYHDQVLIPFKLISGGNGVNYTGGTKVIRTSPAHGTGFDIAGCGIADTCSTVKAIELAIKTSMNRKGKNV